MTAEQTLTELHKYLDFKEKSTWATLEYCKEIYGEDSDEAKNARSAWSGIFQIIDLIEHPEKLHELIYIWEDNND